MIDSKALQKALKRLKKADRRTARELPQIEHEALTFAELQADVNIYLTQPGKYVRTGDYRKSLKTSSSSGGGTLSVNVTNTVPYAVYVELGGTHRPEELQILANAKGRDPRQPLSFGRSGIDWYIAGPILTGAQSYAVSALTEAFTAVLQEESRGKK